MTIAFAILNYALIFICVYFLGKKWNALSTKIFWSAFLVRLAAGITLGLVYTYYYSAGDTWTFFNDAKIFSALARHDFFSYLNSLFDFSESQAMQSQLINQEGRSIFFIKIISVFCLIGNDNYWICAAYFSLLSFICAWMLHRQVITIFPDATKQSSLAFLFFPSVVFWSSGLEKESIALCGVYFLSAGFLKVMSSSKLNKLFWLFVIPFGYAIWGLKYYWAIIFFDSVLTSLLARFLSSKFSAVKKYLIVFWTISFFAIGVLLSFMHPNFYLDQFLEVIISNYNDFAELSDPKNLIHYYQLKGTLMSLLINSPWALLSGLFRPVIGEGQGLLGLAASLENLLLLTFFIGALMNFKKAFTSSHQIILWATISYCMVLCIFLALSTPNFGTLSRYRVGFLPFFVFVITFSNQLVDWISRKFNKA
ncbi:MAG TPA: hypothetical protein VGQ59_08265 [Cyclobacteriaceae bacterium]|nr:hypothetical protein [Cyclobacteriaceae bacterium]